MSLQIDQPVPIAGDSTTSTSYIFGQPSYPSLFRASEERPRFVSFPWWEDEAMTTLWSFDVQAFKRVIRYGIFTDEQLPRVAFALRDQRFIVTNIVQPRERAFFVRLGPRQQVEELVRRCRPTFAPVISWGWMPTYNDRDMNPLAIAKAIDTESHLHFARIPFEEFVRYALNYPCSRVEWFLQQHTTLYAHILDHLNAFPDEVERYTEVEKNLRSRSPFAHRAVVSALQGAGLQLDLPRPSSPGFEFIAGPIQRLFGGLTAGLGSIMKVLCVLGVRYERVYLHSGEINWSRPFSIAFSFLEDILGSTSSSDFARTLTTSDERDFIQLIEDGQFDKKVASRLSARWEALSIEVWECCRALPENIEFIQESLQPLLVLRNYYSLTAILSGLHKHSVSQSKHVHTGNGNMALTIDQVLPPELLYLLEPAQNYAAYRQQYEHAAGIPFLIPHMNEYRQHGEPVLQDLYTRLSTVIPST